MAKESKVYVSPLVARNASREMSELFGAEKKFGTWRRLWLELANHANSHAARFADAVKAHPTACLEYPVHANEVFVNWSAEGFDRLEKAGVQFLTWPGRDDLARFVFSHCTADEETHALCRAIAA